MRQAHYATKAVHALVTDAAQRQALVAVRELGKANLNVLAMECADAETHVPAFASRWCTNSALLPDFAREQDVFIDALLNACAEYSPQALIPSHDGSIEALRARRAAVERAVGLALAPEEALAIAVDKTRTLAVAGALGLRVPRGATVGDPADVAGALEEVGLPAVVKPARSWVQEDGHGQRLHAVAATTREAVLRAANEMLTQGVEAVLQEWLPGDREAISLLYARGRVWGRFAQRATRTVPLLGGSSVRRESIPMPEDVTRDAERLVAEIGLEGYSEIEFRRDARGRPALMEINPRLSASVEVAVRAGMPFPRLLYDWASGGRLQERSGYRNGVRMRWLGGDLSWLKKALADQEHPDAPPPGRALGMFLADFLRPLSYDYLDVRDPRPAVRATAGAAHKALRAKQRTAGHQSDRGTDRHMGSRTDRHAGSVGSARAGADTDVAVIGAGPYGLSISAHLSARGISHEIFGEPMDTWSSHMPVGMRLKSEGFASNLSDPGGECTLERFCREHGLPYEDIGLPVDLDTYERYGRCFQERFVPGLRRNTIAHLRAAGGFELRLDTGETLRARRVIVATGMQGHAYLPPRLRDLPPGAVVHSYDQRDPALWRGLEVAIVGAGQSALDAAVLMHEQGVDVQVLTRAGSIVWNPDPVPGARPLKARILNPRSGLGNGLPMRVYASHPLAVHAAPARHRLRVAYTALGPAGAWWLRPRFEGHVKVLAGRAIDAVGMDGEDVRLSTRGPEGKEELVVSHILAGTGYRVDLTRLRFLDPGLCSRIATAASTTTSVSAPTAASTPVLDRTFQSSVPGLHFVGYPAAGSFGPVMRFVYGADFTARRLARGVG